MGPHPHPALLGAQDGEGPEPVSEAPAGQRQECAASDLDGGDPRARAAGVRGLPHDLRPQYPKAAECLAKDKKAVLACYDFPAEHGHHIRTTNPIESTVATVRLRTAKTRGCVSRTSILSMVFKLAKSAEGHWVKLCGTAQIAKLMQGVLFKNGVEVRKESRQEIAA